LSLGLAAHRLKAPRHTAVRHHCAVKADAARSCQVGAGQRAG